MAERPADYFDELIGRIPTDPGVYVMKDAGGRVIYVGKAKNLRTRVRQYFRPGGDERYFVAAGFLGKVVADVETMVVTDEKEALLLENHLIKKHQPKFNVRLRDDKQYLVLRVLPPDPAPGAAPGRAFPRVEVVRNIRDDGARYFGPYHSASSARETLRVLNRHFQLRTCTDHVLETRGRVCLQFQIKRCGGPCVQAVEPAAYAEHVDDARLFLEGRDRELVGRLRARMAARAGTEDFEAAAQTRDSIAAVERTVSKQHVVQEELVDQDVFGMHRVGDSAELTVLFVRGGKLVGRRSVGHKDQEAPDAEIIAAFVQQYYASGTLIPDEIVVPVPLDDAAVLAEWLGAVRGKKVKLVWPQRGTRMRLIELAEKNAEAAMTSRRDHGADTDATLEKLRARLGLRRLPVRIECYDIAHVQGTDTVASMVTFVDGMPAKQLYRRFKIKTSGNDDFASMYEVLSRRFRRTLRDAPAPDDPWAPPDLLVVDGGKGQLGMAVAALGDLGIRLDQRGDADGNGASMDVISLAKERELAAGDMPDRVYVPGQKDPVALRANTAELFLIARLRDEAHRFANTFHRERRGKAMLRSSLDDIAGIGKNRRTQLLKHFGTVGAIAAASIDELVKAPGMNKRAAAAVAAHFRLDGGDDSRLGGGTRRGPGPDRVRAGDSPPESSDGQDALDGGGPGGAGDDVAGVASVEGLDGDGARGEIGE